MVEPIGELIVERHGGVWSLRLRGEHDLTNAEVLDAEIEAVFAHGSSVIVDLTEATFIDSTVLRALFRGRELADENDSHALAIVCPADSRPVRRILDLVGVPSLIPVYESHEDARAALL
jgi:anti-sigma B factor antagonist